MVLIVLMSFCLDNIEISPEIKVSQPRKKRCLNISARDFAAILGQDPYTDAWKLLEQKVEGKHKFFGNEHTKRGNALEPEAIMVYECVTKNVVNSKLQTTSHPKYPFIRGRPDGISQNNSCLVEIKCPKRKRQYQVKPVDISRQYWMQIQVYLEMYDLEIAHYVEYHKEGNNPNTANLNYCVVLRDRAWWNNSIPKIQNFYDEVYYFTDLGSLDTHPVRQIINNWEDASFR